MNVRILALLAVTVLCGCSRSTIQTRSQERAATYGSLPSEVRELVDQGRIKSGMTRDAVYIAWGRPAQILTGEGPNGVTTETWLYQGTALQEYRYWGYRPYVRGNAIYPEASLRHDYFPRGYVSAEVIFENGVVHAWRTLPQPVY
jgi:hypothetical protein